MDRINIPRHWYKYYNSPALFVTYFGEIYFGTIWELMEYPDRFFIVQNDKIQTIRSLTSEQKTLENYQRLGREIKDIQIIKDIVDGDIGNSIDFKDISYSNRQNFKRMFVFGAAASSFCVFGDAREKFRQCDFNPPTGLELFDAKYDCFIEKFDGAKTCVSLIESMSKDVEQCFQKEWEMYKAYYSPEIAVRHINIQFYMKHLFQVISKEVVEKHFRKNLYSLFVHKLQQHIVSNKSERISLVSFNYDTILESFITRIFGQKFDTMPDYCDWGKNNILVYKPHGSCNWGWKIKSQDLVNLDDIDLARELYKRKTEPNEIYFKLLGNYKEVVAYNSWGHEHANDKYRRGRFTINKNLLELITPQDSKGFIPALLLPYRDKDEMIMPYDHFLSMQHCLNHAEELYLIGWKGNEELFNRQLKQSDRLKKLIVVNPLPDDVLENMSKNGLLKSNIEIIEIKDFEDFVINHMDQLLAKENSI